MTSLTKTDINKINIPFNWPVVGTLLFLTGIAGIPAIFLVALVVLGPSAIDGVSSMINTLHFETPAAILVHGVSGILFFLTMPFQFSPRLRTNNLNRHKIAGRIALISGYIMAISGVWMHNVLSPDSQGTRYVVLILMSMAICLTFSIALWHIIKRNVQVHQKWMARAVAITLAAVTPLFIDILIVILFSHFDRLYTILNQLQYDYGRLIAIMINLLIVEIILTKKLSESTRLNRRENRVAL
ncbi:MAG: DUF2306 domain-containing protein [Colwellia sp.]|nr:DUF2306 domain-containing protein [Colwellia sp.]